MGKFVPPGSKVAVIAGMLSAEDHRQKTAGFSDAFPRHCPGGEIVSVVEGHEDEDESFQKTFDLLGQVPTLAGLYVNTVNCLPVCRALGARGLAGRTKLITTDLFAEMSPYFEKGTITASIYQQPHRQGQMAVRLMADNLTGRVPFPPTVHLSPGVVMSSNLHLFREIRLAGVKFDDSAHSDAQRIARRAGEAKFHSPGIRAEAVRLSRSKESEISSCRAPRRFARFSVARILSSLQEIQAFNIRDLRFFLTNGTTKTDKSCSVVVNVNVGPQMPEDVDL